MKIMKVKSREYNGKLYHKYRINFPGKALKEAGFKEGDELEVKVDKNKVMLKKKK